MTYYQVTEMGAVEYIALDPIFADRTGLPEVIEVRPGADSTIYTDMIDKVAALLDRLPDATNPTRGNQS